MCNEKLNSPKRILIYRLGSLGDTICALPIFRFIREKFPGSYITILTNFSVSAKAAPVTAMLSRRLYDDVIEYGVGTRNLISLGKLWWYIKASHYDIMIYLTGDKSFKSSLRDYLYFKSAGIKHLIGVPLKKRDFEYRALPDTGLWESETQHLIRRIEALGTVHLQPEQAWDLEFSDDELEEARRIMDSLSIPPGFVGINMGGKYKVKQWGKEKWRYLLARMYNDYSGVTIVAFGSADEIEPTDEVISSWPGRKINLCGISSPRTSGAILREAKLFIGHDSGPMHLAAAVGVPVIAIFAGIDLPGVWYPSGTKKTIFEKRTFCSRCGLSVCSNYDSWCIKSISVDDVFNAVRMYLEE